MVRSTENDVQAGAPLLHIASRPQPKGSRPEVWADAQQYGRSPSSLHAELVAMTFREPEAVSLKSPLRTSDLLRSSTLDESDDSTADTRYSSTIHPRPFSLPSPPPGSSLGSNPDTELPETESSQESTNVPNPPPGRPHILAGRSTPKLGIFNMKRANNALTVQDLGSDYSRYFSPFSPNERHSIASKASMSPPKYFSIPQHESELANPFRTPNTSTTELNADFDAEKNGSLINDRLNAPYDDRDSLAWPLWGDQKEDDDDMHMPLPDDDIRFRTHWKDHFSRSNIGSTIGLILLITGLCFIFVALPVLSSIGIIDYAACFSTPLDQMPEPRATVNNLAYPLLENVRTGLIDPDTLAHALAKEVEYGDAYTLVFSDEFNDPNRTFYEGDDPYFFVPDIWYGATEDLEWYDPDAVTTQNGVLELRLDKFVNHGLNFCSGMLNSWNHLCFKGGIFKVSMSLPSPAGPYTYQACDAGITPNQSSPDGHSHLPEQRLPSCTCPGEDHPTPGAGRGAPEIDIAEVGASSPPFSLLIATQSYQVAPFDVCYTDDPFQQAISATTNLRSDWFDGKAYQHYSFEYIPGESSSSYIVWKVGGQTIESWTWIDWDKLVFTTVLQVDYVRWYQKEGEEMVTCDPPGWETTGYIREHANAYVNPNFTKWDQTGHEWPKHKLNSNC
ncbi:glycoside hydrolase family 16 protein [Lentithecium fluviatile CBS 122367]|uniref:Glycoside hydrolase family 16 protein n=1 Tax=Lentithecium fluviatile CBS 122367 TaxID=1168545 RepID=A0A6G1J1F4_9PLEO|nr:glycoside hydrolase family 16 protein [Lentithecium fluviatile CBS 122367]